MLFALILSTIFPPMSSLGDADDWRIYRTSDGICGIESELVSQTHQVVIGVIDSPNKIVVGVSKAGWKSIVDRQTYPITVTVGKTVVAQQGQGAVGPQGDHFIMAPVNRGEFYSAVGKGGQFVFARNGEEIAVANISGPAAMAQFWNCMGSGNDPFAK
jgi:hypothetical protein